jgi:hypothetical protein
MASQKHWWTRRRYKSVGPKGEESVGPSNPRGPKPRIRSDASDHGTRDALGFPACPTKESHSPDTLLARAQRCCGLQLLSDTMPPSRAPLLAVERSLSAKGTTSASSALRCAVSSNPNPNQSRPPARPDLPAECRMVVSGPLGVGLNLVAAARLPRGPARANRHPPPLIPRNSVRINSIAANNAAVDTRSSGPAFPTAGWPLSPIRALITGASSAS